MAIGVLQVFDEHTRENVEDVLVRRYIRDIGMDVIELALHCKCERFVSHLVIQKSLDNIWNGKSDSSEIIHVIKKDHSNYF